MLSRPWGFAGACALSVVLSLTGAPAATGQTAPGASAPALTHEQRFRRSQGLRFDAPYLAELHTAALAAGPAEPMRYGILLTDEEERELDARAALNDEAAPKIQQYLAEHPDVRNGGLYIDPSTGALTVALAQEHAGLLDALRSLMPDELRSRVATVLVANDVERLHRTQRELITARKLDGRFTVTSVAVDYAANDVVVRAKGDLGAATDALNTEYGTLVRVVADSGLTFNVGSIGPRMGTSALNAPPLRGGQRMETTTSAWCTEGFIARDTTVVPFAYYSLSAGHCGAPGSPWYHPDAPPAVPSYPIGRVTRNALPSTGGDAIADALAMRISTNAQSNDVAVYGGGVTNVNITAREAQGGSVQGSTACNSALVVPWQCGTVEASSVDACVTAEPGAYPAGHEVCFYWLRQVGIETYGGDSGSPFMTTWNAQLNATAKGITTIATEFGAQDPYTLFSHIYDVLWSLEPMELVLSTF